MSKCENSPFFSIITPIYNAEPFLEECIQSILMQSFSDWELILVDDGSTDRSGEIIDNYSALDDRIIAIHKANGGEFSSRYCGLKKARGVYVTGVDADDYIQKDHLKNIKEYLDKDPVDVIMFSFSLFGKRNEIIELPKEYLGKHSGDEMLLLVLESTLHAFCSKAIKRELILNTDYSDIPSVKISEDYLLVVPALCHCQSGNVVELYSYMYRIRIDSASQKCTYKQLFDLCEVSSYGITKLSKEGKKDSIFVEAEHVGFLKVFINRILFTIKENEITKDELNILLNHPSYVQSANAEKKVSFGKFKFLCMLLLRHKMIRLLKLILNLKKIYF